MRKHYFLLLIIAYRQIVSRVEFTHSLPEFDMTDYVAIRVSSTYLLLVSSANINAVLLPENF